MKPACLLLLAATLGGTTACVAPSSGVHAQPSAAINASPAGTPRLPAPAIGPVLPAPAGCLAMVFLAPGDERNVVRNARGRITEIITRTGRKEPVLARILWGELEELVPLIADIVAKNDPERISHIPSFYSQGHIPGPAAWAYLRPYLRDDDAAWTFGETETGLLITRDSQPFCIVYVQRPFMEP
jgi:hypothetical protein